MLRQANHRRALAALAAGLLFAGCSESAETPSETVVEAESLTLASDNGTVVSAGESGDERALRMFANDAASTSVRLGAAKQVAVRARGDWCDGPPTLEIAVDGKRVLREPLRSSGWATYRSDVELDEGEHDVAVKLVDDLANEECDRSLVVDDLTFRSSRDTEDADDGADPDESDETRASRLLFQADFRDGISEYPYVIHRNRIDVVDDPILGDKRKVLKFEVFNGDTGPTENPRAQLETAYNFEEGDDRYFGLSFFFPRDFPTELPDRGWVTLGEQAYGPPFANAAAVSLRAQNAVGSDEAELRWQRNDTYDHDIPWVGPKIADLRGKWVDIVQRIRLDDDPDKGFVELWMNTGDGWERQELHGKDRLYMSTYDSAADGGPNNSRLSLYYTDEIEGPLTFYHGAHKIATAGEGAFEAVDPGSYEP